MLTRRDQRTLRAPFIVKQITLEINGLPLKLFKSLRFQHVKHLLAGDAVAQFEEGALVFVEEDGGWTSFGGGGLAEEVGELVNFI